MKIFQVMPCYQITRICVFLVRDSMLGKMMILPTSQQTRVVMEQVEGCRFRKIDAVTAKVLEGAVFKVVNTKTQQVVQETLTTNQAGQIRLAGLEAGQYAFI